MQVSVEFTAELIEWRGPAPFYFAPLTEDAVRQAEGIRLGARVTCRLVISF